MTPINTAPPAGGPPPARSSRHRALFEALQRLPLAEWIGLAGLYLFLFFAWESNGRARGAYIVLLIGCLASRRFWRDIKASPVFWVLLLFAGYLVVRGTLAILQQPGLAHYHLQDGYRFLLLGGFVPVAWLLRGNRRRIHLALVVALLGFWFGRMEHFPWSSLGSGEPWWTVREKFGLPSEIGFGLYTASATLGLLLFAPRIRSWARTRSRRLLAWPLWALSLALCLQGVVIAQSRGVWLALLLVAAGLGIANIRHLRALGWRRNLGLALALAGALALFLHFNYRTIEIRLTLESGTVQNLLEGKLGAVRGVDSGGNIDSVGIRYHMLRFGYRHWMRNPLFGLGPGISKPLIKKRWPYEKTFNHLHNNYLELLLRFGIVGLGLVFAMLALILRGAHRAVREGRMDRDLFRYLVASLALVLMISLFSFRMLHVDWRFFWFLIGGTLYSFSFPPAEPSSGRPAAP